MDVTKSRVSMQRSMASAESHQSGTEDQLKRKKKRRKNLKRRPSGDQYNLWKYVRNTLSGHSIESENEDFVIPGLVKLALTNACQQTLGCEIGVDVTAENPWVYVERDRIKKYMLDDTSCPEFLMLRKEVMAYPEEELFVGYIPEESLKEDLFYVATTIMAKQGILTAIEKRKYELEENLKTLICMPVGTWLSLGSDVEIDEDRVTNIRPLHHVQIKSRFPIVDTKVIFKMRKVEDAKDGYVEILPDGLQSFECVEKRRIDMGVQASPSKISSSAQTNPTYPSPIWTQYEFQYDHAKSPDPKTLTKFLSKRQDEIENTLINNSFMNLHCDDYAALNKHEITRHRNTFADIKLYRSFYQAELCKGKTVSACVWSPFVSGIVAVAYCDANYNDIEKTRTYVDKVDEAVFHTTPVVIWSYTEPLEPKMHLTSPRQVVCLSFCPFKKHILVGGCINGQIVVWDLTDSLEKLDEVEVLNFKQQENRTRLYRLLNWMKKSPRPNIIAPWLISDKKFCHKTRVSSLTWLHPTLSLSNYGKLSKLDPGESSLQIVSTGLRGKVIVWDFSKNSITKEETIPVMLKRLAAVPSNITLKNRVGVIQPTCELLLYGGDKRVAILPSLGKIDRFTYKPTSTHGLLNPNHRNYFDLIEEFEDVSELMFVCASDTSQIMQFGWEGLDYCIGGGFQSDKMKVKMFYKLLHDGVVTDCKAHPHIKDLFLSVGGTTFAVWKIDEEGPLLWRKCREVNVMYTAGGWSERSVLVLSRSDGYIEFWDLASNQLTPTSVSHLELDSVSRLFGLVGLLHSRKRTYAGSDHKGLLYIYSIPEMVSKDERMFSSAKLKEALHPLFNVNEWVTEKFSGRKCSRIESIDCSILSETECQKNLAEEIEKMERIFTGFKWKTNEEKNMFNTMISRSGVELNKLQIQAQALKALAEDKKKKRERMQQTMHKKSKVFTQAKSKLLHEVQLGRNRIYSVAPSLDQSILNYMEDYLEIEDRALAYIDANKYQKQFDWVAHRDKFFKIRRDAAKARRLTGFHDRYTLKKTSILETKWE